MSSTLPKYMQAQNSTGLGACQQPESELKQRCRIFLETYRNLPDDFLEVPAPYYSAPSEFSLAMPSSFSDNTPLVDMIEISVVEAQLVKNYGLLRMDLYCKIRVGHYVAETTTCQNGARNPRWDGSGVYQFALKPGIDSFHMEIYDEKQFSNDEKIAWLHEPIPPEIYQGVTVERWFPLSGRLGPQKEGAILLVVSHKRVPFRSSGSSQAILQQHPGSMPIFIPPSSGQPLILGGRSTVLPVDPNTSTYSLPQPPPWFGIDVGGSLVKVVFFDPKETTRQEFKTLQRIRQYLWSSKAYGGTGRRDAHLEMQNCSINGRIGSLHFIRFATSEMSAFLAMAKRKQFADDVLKTICATGGGACKFDEDIRKTLGIKLHKIDEFDSIIYGIPYVNQCNSKRECYFLSNPMDEVKCAKVLYDFSRPYPYLVVNIGSGVSILAVYSQERYSRISGSSLGGGTFLGLCCLLTQCETFDEAISLAVAGSSVKVNKLVKDIYGGDYPKFELSGDTVASAFGNMNLGERREQAKREDLARALLEMVTNNIGSIARMCAVNHGIDRVVFIGNFLRTNQLSMKLLSFAVDYWSKGAIKALFLEHEGYFGAVGCLVESTKPSARIEGHERRNCQQAERIDPLDKA